MRFPGVRARPLRAGRPAQRRDRPARGTRARRRHSAAGLPPRHADWVNRAAAPEASTLRDMQGEFSWLVLVAAFAAVMLLCGFLAVRLLRIGAPGRKR